MRAKAPLKVHLRCLKSIYTHILLRSLLYELLMNSTFHYPTFLIHRGKKKQTRKPVQAVCKTDAPQHSLSAGLGRLWEQQSSKAPLQRGDGEEKEPKVGWQPPNLLVSYRSHLWDFTATSPTEQEVH